MPASSSPAAPGPEPAVICVTDVGSTTTKARLFLRDGPEGAGEWTLLRREAATTVERPDEDVTVGVVRALEALEREEPARGLRLIRDGRPAVPYFSTSSAGGGLAVAVAGLVREITARSAERVALGAGAIVLDVIGIDDGRTPYRKIRELEALRPDLVLLAGGFDGEAISGPVFLTELLREADLHPKRNPEAKLPVVYAGNRHALPFVREALGDRFLLRPVENLRPSATKERLGPAREAIHELFMDHVMSQAPGYPRLKGWVDGPLLPTPAAFGRILELASRETGERLLAVDVGGATTDVFTARNGEVHRTVSANLGLSYSILHVLRTAGFAALRELLDPGPSDDEIMNRLGAKHLDPTRLPRDELDAEIERAIATLAVREAVRAHLRVLRGHSEDRGEEELGFTSPLRRGDPVAARPWSRDADGRGDRSAAASGAFGTSRSFGAAAAARKTDARLREVRPDGYDLVIGSGGALSHAPRETAARILVDALGPSRRTALAVDSAFVFPHLGALSTARPQLAVSLFHRVGLVRLGTAADHEGGRARAQVPAAGAFRTAARSDEAVQHGVLRLARRLSVPGEVLVRRGDVVAGDAVIARSTRLFLRPFFLPVASALEVPPGDIGPLLLKRPGDAIEVGDLLARRKARLRTREYHATVSGTIERLLPDGTLLVREHAESAREVVTVDLVRELGIQRGKLAPYVRCSAGQEVEPGQVLASDLRPGSRRIARSPIRGRIAAISVEEGWVRVEPLREELEVRAWIPGRVVEVDDRGAVVEAAGVELTGAWGCGGEASGVLRFPEDEPRAGAGLPVAESWIGYRDHLTADDLERLAEAGTSGVLAAGADLAPLSDRAWPFTVVVLEGFEAHPLRPEFSAILAAARGSVVYADGTTELRVGVRRPRVLAGIDRARASG